MLKILSRFTFVLVALAMVASACGSDGDSEGSASSGSSSAVATTAAPVATTTAAPATTAAAETEATSSDESDVIKVALLLPGVKNDNSFSQAGYEGLVAAAAADGSIEYQVIEEIIDPTDSLPAIRDFASQGYDLIIGHGIEYVDPIQQLWAEFPDVDFAMAGGILIPGSVTTPNVADWLYNTQDMAWPNGVLTANALVGDTIGIVGGPEFDFVKGMHQSYREAVLSINPDVNFLEGFAGSFVDVQRAAEVAQQHIDQGADLIYCSGDGICIGAAQAASAAGIPIAVGFGSQEQAAPDAYLAATVIRLDGLYGTWFDQVRDGSFGTSGGELTFGEEGYAFFPSGIFNGQVEVMPVNMNATVETAMPLADLQALMDEFVTSVQNGEFMIPFPGVGAPPEEEEASGDPDPIRVRLNWIADPGFLGLYMADELGYFADENVEAIFEFGGPNVPHPVQILAGGAADVGFGSLSIIADAQTQGEEFVMFGTRLQQGILGISSLAETPINTAADICGKKIGATPADVGPLDALLITNGLDPGCYEMVPVGWDPSPVAEGLVDGMVNYMNSHPVVLDGMGIDNVAVSYADMGMQMYADIAFANKDFVDNNRDVLVRFTRAMVKGWEAAFADPETALDVMYNGSPNLGGGIDVGMDPSYQIWIHYAQVPLMESALTETDGLFSMDYDSMVGDMWDALAVAGIDPLPAPDPMIDLSILEDAFGDCRPALLGCDG